MSDNLKWFKYRMTSPPMEGYIEAESEESAHKLMEQHDHFSGYHNSANNIEIEFVTEDTDKIRQYIDDIFRPNEGVRSDGTVVRRDDDW